MKLNDKFILKEMSGVYVLIPFGEKALDFNGVVTINESAKFLYEQCSKEIDKTTLILRLKSEYAVDEKTAEETVEMFIKQMIEVGCIDE